MADGQPLGSQRTDRWVAGPATAVVAARESAPGRAPPQRVCAGRTPPWFRPGIRRASVYMAAASRRAGFLVDHPIAKVLRLATAARSSVRGWDCGWNLSSNLIPARRVLRLGHPVVVRLSLVQAVRHSSLRVLQNSTRPPKYYSSSSPRRGHEKGCARSWPRRWAAYRGGEGGGWKKGVFTT